MDKDKDKSEEAGPCGSPQKAESQPEGIFQRNQDGSQEGGMAYKKGTCFLHRRRTVCLCYLIIGNLGF